MNIAMMRAAVGNAYPRRTWKNKVLNMSDEQVLAIYKSMVNDGRLFNHTKQDLQKEREAERVRQQAQKTIEQYYNSR